MPEYSIIEVVAEFSKKIIDNSVGCEKDFYFSGIGTMQEAKNEIICLLSYVLEKDKVFLLTHGEYQLTDKEFSHFLSCFERRVQGEPLAYIVGKKEFFGYDFFVDNSTLIPRADTEILVEEAIGYCRSQKNVMPDKPFSLLDLGTGTGCILLSIIKECRNIFGVGIDVNERAVELARKNSRQLDIRDQCFFMQADFTQADFMAKLSEKLADCDFYGHVQGKEQVFDLIVSNPPYIPDTEYAMLHANVKAYEPKSALVSEDLTSALGQGMAGAGLFHAEKVMQIAERLLKKNGVLIMEHGYNQGQFVCERCADFSFKDIKTLYDYGQNERALFAMRR